MRGFPGNPAVKSLPSKAGGAGLIPGWEAKIPTCLLAKNQNMKQKQYCNKFNKKRLKMVHIKKKKVLKKKRVEMTTRSYDQLALPFLLLPSVWDPAVSHSTVQAPPAVPPCLSCPFCACLCMSIQS